MVPNWEKKSLMKTTLDKRARPQDSGNMLVEFALAILVFLVLMFAIYDFGFFYFTKVTLQNAVRQAGRYAITGTCTGGSDCFGGGTSNRYNSIVQTAVRYGFGLITTSNVTVTCLAPPVGQVNGCPAYGAGAGGPGDTVQITVTYTWKPVSTAVSKLFTGGKYVYSVSSVFKNEMFPPPAS
jgi:Flp pilus assembly protein TadG